MSTDIEKFWVFKNYQSKKDLSTYRQNIYWGQKICKRSKIAVVSLARNCEKNLQKSIDHILSLCSSNLKFFIYENNSTDNTKNILIKNKSDNLTISLNSDNTPHLVNRSRERTNNLANYRNICLEWVKKEHNDFNYVIVLDLDSDGGFCINGIYNSISWLCQMNNAAGMGSYSLYHNILSNQISHYDTFAARLEDWSESSSIPSNFEQVFSHYHPVIGSKPINFYSCFGGLAIYKMSCFLSGTYDGSIGCEHILFHKSIHDATGSSMYLNPSSRFLAVLKDA